MEAEKTKTRKEVKKELDEKGISYTSKESTVTLIKKLQAANKSIPEAEVGKPQPGEY